MKMKLGSQVQILAQAVCISLYANASGKKHDSICFLSTQL